MSTEHHPGIIRQFARALTSMLVAGSLTIAAEPQDGFAAKIAAAENAGGAGDFVLFRAKLHDAIQIATDGKGDGAELHTLFETLSAYPVTTKGAATKDAYSAWLASVKEVLAFDDSRVVGYPNVELPGVLQSQADCALLLVRTSGIPYVDAAADSNNVYQVQFELVGTLLGRWKARIKNKADAIPNPNLLSPEAVQALHDSKEAFIAGGDPQLIKDKRARDLVQRDYDKNRRAEEVDNQQEFLKRAFDKLQRETVTSAKRLIESGKIDRVSTAKSLNSTAVPRVTWEKLLADGA